MDEDSPIARSERQVFGGLAAGHVPRDDSIAAAALALRDEDVYIY